MEWENTGNREWTAEKKSRGRKEAVDSQIKREGTQTKWNQNKRD